MTRPVLLQSGPQSHMPLIYLCCLRMLPIPCILPRSKWRLKVSDTIHKPLPWRASADLIDIILFGEKTIWDGDQDWWGADWNGMLSNGEEVGVQPENVVPWLPAIRFSNNSKNPHLLKSIILLTQPLVKQPHGRSRFQPCPL